MTAPTTRAERIEAVDDIVRRRTVTLGPNTPSEIAKEIDAYYHPRTLRPVQTALGVVTYHEENSEQWRWRLTTDKGICETGDLAYVGRPFNARLTDDELERCLPLRKQPWEE